tara:strand:+ start:238 stop:450 length:213 start_codon:yes stop_codon:yes gene_type:complete
MGISRESLLLAITYWKAEKENNMLVLEDLLEDSLDEPTFDKVKELKSISKDLEDIDLVLRRITQLLTKFN